LYILSRICGVGSTPLQPAVRFSLHHNPLQELS
jgi:hypothetical protein